MSLHFKYSKSLPLPIELRAEFSTDHVVCDVFANIPLTQLTGPSFPALSASLQIRVINSRPGTLGGCFRFRQPLNQTI